MSRSTKIDWAAVELEFKAGMASLREIGRKYGISEGAIRKRAKAEGWTREKVRARSCVPTHVEPQVIPPTLDLKPEHLVTNGQELVMRMLSELDATTSHVGELEKLIEQATAGDPNDKRYEAMMRAVSLPTRANIIKTLALAAKTLSETAAPLGKKQERQLAAERVASGKFGVPSAPKLVVDNKR